MGKTTRREMETIAHEAIQRSVAWEADVTPMPVNIETEPSGRHAAVILAANDAILHMELEAYPPSDAAGIARLLSNAIDSVLVRGGAPPAELSVRHAAVAVELGNVRSAATKIVTAPKLSTIDDFAMSFRKQMSGVPLPPISQPQMWAAWQLPADVLDRVFSAAAKYYAAAPWILYGDDAPLELAMPNSSSWIAVVLGVAGEHFGLVLYERLEDYLELVHATSAEDGFNATQGAVISLSFDARADLPKPMRREFTDSKWTVAGPGAYPSIWVLNTIGGGVSADQANDLATALEVISRLGTLEVEDDALLEQLGASWTDETSGTIVRWAGTGAASLWKIPAELTSSLAQGSRADALARFGLDDDDGAEDAAIVARFGAAMRASGTDAERARRDEQDADFFVQLMHGEQGVRLPAVTELDLRAFLYLLLPRKSMTTKDHGNAIRATLDRFFDYLATSENLNFPWAKELLRDDAVFEERWDSCPRGHQHDETFGDWLAELFEDFDARVMLPASELTDVGSWDDAMGNVGTQLYDQLKREWLIWRDDEIALGHRVPSEVWQQLTARQSRWEQTPQPELGGLSPSEAIAKERGTRRRAKPRTPRK